VRALCLLLVARLWAPSSLTPTADGPSPKPTPAPARVADGGERSPWAEWFPKNVQVTDKKTYVHFFWNANDAKQLFDGKEKKQRLAQAARELVLSHYPATALSDKVKVDIVYVAERDGYGNPRWETLHRVAHLECSKKKLAETRDRAEDLSKVFERFDLY
jgi:hypothetical protein